MRHLALMNEYRFKWCSGSAVLGKGLLVLIASDGEVELADFGLARSFADPYLIHACIDPQYDTKSSHAGIDPQYDTPSHHTLASTSLLPTVIRSIARPQRVMSSILPWVLLVWAVKIAAAPYLLSLVWSLSASCQAHARCYDQYCQQFSNLPDCWQH